MVLIEVARNLGQKANRKAVQRFLRMVREPHFEVSQIPTSSEIEQYFKYIHAKDAHVLASASLAQCDFLITWDRKHFKAPSLASFPIKILTPQEFAEQYCG
ncbi:MAG: hypothetical protein Kow0099_25100 [Candidatus Abyssubacteria bacterium]